MTKVSVFGQETEKKKPIEPVKFLTTNGDFVNWDDEHLRIYDNVQLLYGKSAGIYDIFLVWKNNSDPFVVLGHWNDGFVE